ncbi:MAG TPA: Rrf2 family transcriptional regulator [Polyangia bacterium]|nr:Rrf2 family transcriptional regulator [Polyangia bacterium]
MSTAMVVATRARYALHVLACFAGFPAGTSLMAEDLLRMVRVPRWSLDGVLLGLTHAGILSSKKGRAGGYSLLVPSERITVGEILRIFDGGVNPLPCLAVPSDDVCGGCPDDPAICGTRALMARVRDAAAAVLDVTTIADLAGPPESQA